MPQRKMTKISAARNGITVAISDIAAITTCGIVSFKCGTGERGIRFRWGLVLTMAVFLMQCPSTRSVFVSRPMNAVTMVGGSLRMGCSRDASSDAVDWEFAPARSNITTFIYTGREILSNLTSRYRIDTDGRKRYDLVIDSVDLSHAGTYICTPVIPGESAAPSGSAQLNVLESDPTCNTNASVSNGGNLDGDFIRIWCTVNYNGNLIPVMTWKNDTDKRRVSFNSGSTEATSTITTPLYPLDDGVPIQCNTTFNPRNHFVVRSPRQEESLANNDPDYQYLWTFRPSVLFSPVNITTKPKQSVFFIGDRLECSAKGNPVPTYEWMDVKTRRTFYGPFLTIDRHFFTESEIIHSYSCGAENTVAGVRKLISETVTFQVRAAASTVVNAAGLIAEIALGFAVALLVKTRL